MTARATGHLTRTNVGKESATSPHFAALLHCAALHAAPPQLLLISVTGACCFGQENSGLLPMRNGEGKLGGSGDQDGSQCIHVGAECVARWLGGTSGPLSLPA
eukprot:COSAG02_NODE_5101_length_4629_cov_36.514128_7_plen_103_part_00